MVLQSTLIGPPPAYEPVCSNAQHEAQAKLHTDHKTSFSVYCLAIYLLYIQRSLQYTCRLALRNTSLYFSTVTERTSSTSQTTNSELERSTRQHTLYEPYLPLTSFLHKSCSEGVDGHAARVLMVTCTG